MRKFFLISLMTLCTCVMAWATNVATLSELQNALAAGGDITLTADINAGATALNVAKGISLNGNGHYVKTTDTYVFKITTSDVVRFEDVVIYGAKTSAGRGLHISVSNAKVTLEKVTINAQIRGIDVFVSGSGVLDNVSLTINNSTIQHVHSSYGISYAVDGTPSDPTIFDRKTVGVNSDYSRGVNMGRLSNSIIEINNSAIQGFFYNINNISGTMANSSVVASNCTFKGRCAFNIWGAGGTFVCNDCNVLGHNNFAGATESFACFVINNQTTTANNTLTINGGTYAGVSFNADGSANPNARQFLVRAQGAENLVTINNCSYSCPKDLGDSKGGVAEYIGSTCSVIVNDGIYSCPEIVEGVYSDATHVASLAINGGSYDLNAISSDMTDGDVYRAIALTGGTYNLDMSVVDPGNAESGLIADGYKQVANANGTYSIVPEATEEKVANGTDKNDDGVNDVNWNTAADWATTSQEATVVPDAATSVTIGNGTEDVSVVVADDGAADVYRVDLNDKVTLTVQDGGVLTVGEGGIVSHENAAVVVEEGGSLVLNGLIQGTENIVIEASETNSAAVLINPNVNTYGDEHPVGTFRFTSKSYRNGDKVVHQRFGMPAYNTVISMAYDDSNVDAKTYIVNWDYENDRWALNDQEKVNWLEIDRDATVIPTVGPFACYDLISYNTSANKMTYEFKGALMGNADGEMKFNRGFNPYANSYTAPIDIASFLTRLDEEYAGTGIDATLYLYQSQANDNYTWNTLNASDYLWGAEEGYPVTIAPMQAFMLRLDNSTPQTASLDYKDNVYDPFMAKLNNPAPRRSASVNKNYMSISIIDSEGTEYDRVKFIEDSRFSSAFENGYDAVKFMQENVAIYAALDEAQATVASDYVEGMNIGVKVAKSGVYTLNVKFNGLDYALIDTENNTIIELVAGNKYNFFAEAGQNDARFQVIKVNKVSTAIDEVENDQVLSTKMMKDGVLYIIKNGAVYNAQGQIVK